MASVEVEQFIEENGLDGEAADIIRECPEELVSKVIARGPCSGCRNPPSVLRKRIQDAQADGHLDFSVEVEQFLGENEVDEKAQSVLRSATASVQRMVIERGPVSDSNNPSAALMSRIKSAMNGGKGEKGDSKGGKGGKGGWGGMGMGMGMMDMSGPPEGGWPGSAGLDANPPPLHWLSFAPGSSVVSYGMPPWCAALVYDKANTVFQSSHHILQECVPDVTTMTKIDHDEEWRTYPEVGQALKQMTGEDNCFAIAFSLQYGVWGVGFAAGKKGRESAAKLALSMSLASGNPQLHMYLRSNYPEYDQVVGAPAITMTGIGGMHGAFAGCSPAGGGGKGKSALGGGALLGGCGGWGAEEPVAKKRKKAGGGDAEAGSDEVTVHTLELPATVVPDGPFPVPALYHTKSTNRVFTQATQILKKLLSVDDAGEGMLEAMIEIKHDADWAEFPDIAVSVKAAGMEEDCYALASCTSMGKYAVGLASGWKNRENAAQLALALSVAADSPALPDVCTKYPDFGRICKSSGLLS